MVTRPRLTGAPSCSGSSSLVLALAKQAQMAWFRSRRSPYQGGMIVSGVIVGVVGLVDRAVRFGQGRAGRQGRAVRAVERERAAAGWGGDEVAAVVDQLVVPRAQADQVVQVGAAAVDPVLDVVQVGPAGLAAREPAPAAVPLPGGAADRGAGAAPPPAQGQDSPASPWVIQDSAAVQASICAVDTLIAGPSSTWHRAGSAGSPGTRAGPAAFPRKRRRVRGRGRQAR